MYQIKQIKKEEMNSVVDEHVQPTNSVASTLPTLLLLILNAFLMVLGQGAYVLLRLYFIHGGSRLWLSSFLQFAGWPILLIPIFLSSFIRNRRPFQLPLSVYAAAAALGLLNGLNGYLSGYGSSYLPLSSSSILMASQLSFVALFSFLINRQCFTAYRINAVVLLTLGPVVLGLSSRKDRPVGESIAKYHLGFVMTLAAAALIGLLMPAMERVYKMVKERLDFGTVMEIMLVNGVFGSGFGLVGMAANNDFQTIGREAREFGLGKEKYYIVIICAAILFQLGGLGLLGVIFCSSSLFGGVLNAFLLPISEILAVIFFSEKFDGNKGIALALCLWGFTSYLYGEKKQSKKLEKKMVELPSSMP